MIRRALLALADIGIVASVFAAGLALVTGQVGRGGLLLALAVGGALVGLVRAADHVITLYGAAYPEEAS